MLRVCVYVCVCVCVFVCVCMIYVRWSHGVYIYEQVWVRTRVCPCARVSACSNGNVYAFLHLHMFAIVRGTCLICPLQSVHMYVYII